MWQKILNWFLNENNPSLPKSEYLYGTRHLLVLGAVVILTILIYFLFRNKSEKSKRVFFTVSALIFLFFEITSRIYNLIMATSFSVESVVKIILPMHFCSVTVWFIIIALLFKNKILINISPILGILATGIYLAYPAVGLNSTYINFPQFYSVFTHSFGFVISVSLITLNYSKLDIKKIWQTYLTFGIIIVYGLLLDLVIFPVSDYMYLTENPLPFNPIIPFQLILGAILISYIFICYIPSLVRLLKKSHKNKLEKTIV